MPPPSPACSLPMASTTRGPHSPQREPPKAPIAIMNTIRRGRMGNMDTINAMVPHITTLTATAMLMFVHLKSPIAPNRIRPARSAPEIKRHRNIILSNT